MYSNRHAARAARAVEPGARATKRVGRARDSHPIRNNIRNVVMHDGVTQGQSFRRMNVDAYPQ